MEIGKLNQRITVLENRTVVDEIGNHTAKWEEAFSCWANVTVKSSSESDPSRCDKRSTDFAISDSAAADRNNLHDKEPDCLSRCNL